MASVKLVNVYKIYDGGVKAVSNFNLDIEDDEFVVFVGPSGCGKSTTLRMIAGLEDITSGELYIDNKMVNDLEPKDRDIAMVFQNYALYPHMTVYDNMAFGLKQIHMDKAEIDRRVNNAAEILGISPLLSRKPKALSGGQRQRVALGRAIVREPKVFLLDEPLSNLDAKLRVQMRSEITKIHEKAKTTFIYVTHDQTEAMTMGSKIVVMKDGVIQQVDSPKNLYDAPNNVFVATFLGSPQMNLFPVNLILKDGELYGELVENKTICFKMGESIDRQLIDREYIGKEVIMGIRPEDISISSENDCNFGQAEVNFSEMLGSESILYTKIEGHAADVLASVRNQNYIEKGLRVYLKINNAHIHLFDKDTQKRIIGLPEENWFEGKISFKDNGYDLKINKETISFDENDLVCIHPHHRNDDKVIIGVSPLKISLQEFENAIKLEGEVNFVVESGNSKIIYLKNVVKDKPFIIRIPANNKVNVGEKMKLFLNPTDIVLRDINTKNIIKTRYPFFENKITSEVTLDKKGNVRIYLGKNIVRYSKEELPQITESGIYELAINNDAFSGDEATVKAHKKSIIKVHPINEESLGDSKVIYAKDDNFNGYISMIVDNNVSIFQKRKRKLYINPQGIVVLKKVS